MNLVLFRPEECTRPLPASDSRAHHIREVLRRGPGESFDCGLVDGPRGRARVVSCDADGLRFDFTWSEVAPPPLAPVTLLAGLPRPQTARKILGEATTLGIARLVFFRSARGEPSYGDSTLWTSGEVDRLLVASAEQAFCTRLPAVVRADSLAEALARIAVEPEHAPATRLALDNYEATAALADAPAPGTPAVLAVGPERGWSPAERDTLRRAGFTLAHLGTRVLRVETACTAGLAVLKTRLGLW